MKTAILSWEDMAERIHIDMKLPFAYINEKLIQEISLSGAIRKRKYKTSFCRKKSEGILSADCGKESKCIKISGAGFNGESNGCRLFWRSEKMSGIYSEKTGDGIYLLSLRQ